MGQSSLNRLPEVLRFRGDLVGLICGSVTLLLAFIGPLFGSLFSGATGIVFQIVVVSTLAGILGCLFGHDKTADASSALAPRVGVRASIIASFVGAAFVVIVATLHSFGVGSPASPKLSVISLIVPQSYAFQILGIAVMGIPPAIFFGTAASILTALRGRSSSGERSDADGVPPAKQTGLNSAIQLLCIVGLLSPFVVLLKPKAKPKPVIVAPATPAPVVPVQKKWRYQKPAGFDAAEASRIVISDIRAFSEVEGGFPVALSPDERLFAYFTRTPSLALEIRDLENLDVISRAEISDEPVSLVWAPDNGRILIEAKGELRRLHVFRLNTSQLVSLPQPVNSRIPEGKPEWIGGEEVAFAHEGGPTILSLKTLRTAALSDSAVWNALPKERQDAIRSGVVTPRLPKNSRFQMGPAPMIRRYELPTNSSSDWPLNSWLHLTVGDAEKSYRHALFPIELNIGDLVLGTKDGTKLIRIRDRSLSIFYLGLRETPPTRIEVVMPSAPDASISDALKQKSLCAFVCGPLINPLNGETVGPDRTKVRGIARFKSWEGTNAELWIGEDYASARKGDVVADIHTWKDHRTYSASELAKNEWFAVIDRISVGSIPSREEASALDRQVSVLMKGGSGADRIEKIVAAPVSTPANVQAPARIPSNEGVSSDAILPQLEGQLRAFIGEHHLKSSRGDVNGLVANYADRVDYFTNGIVDRAFIRKDELEYHSPGTRVTETIISPPTFRRMDRFTYEAKYTISFNRVRADGKWTRGVSDVELRIADTQAGLRITRQRSETRDQQKGP